MKKYFPFLLLICFAFSTCRDDDPINLDQPKGDVSKGVYVINEGTFTLTSGSLSLYNPDSQKVENDVFRRINNRPIGDVFQSMYLYNDKYFAVVNNMQKIEVLNSQTLKSEALIEGLNSPRYFLPVNASKAYVTDLYANGIWIIDPSTYQVLRKIGYEQDKDTLLNNWTEQMIMHKGEVFVCAPKQQEILVIDAGTDTITKVLMVKAEPQWMQLDKNNKLWVLCDGAVNGKNSYLYCIDPDAKRIIRTFEFESRARAVSELKINAEGDVLYFIYKDVYRMSVTDNALPQTPFITAGSKQFYGLGIDPNNNDIYVSDAVDNVQQGYVLHYTSGGAFKHQFQVGVSPGEFLFVQ